MPLLRIRGRLGGRGARRAMLVTGVVSALVIGVSVGVYAAATPSGTGPGGCFDPSAAPSLAIPNDGQDDAPKIQAAIDDIATANGGTLCLGAGHWTIGRAKVPHNVHSGLSTHSAHLTITGSGPGTVLDLVGDQGRSDISVISLDPGASDVRIERLAIDTSAARNTDVQTHAIGIGSAACPGGGDDCGLAVTDVTVRDVTFRHPVQTDGTLKGDCIRIFGQRPTMPVKRVTIAGSSFLDCDRSGIAVQRNVVSLAVVDNHFGEKIGDTAFDSEATGGGDDEGLRLIGNSFADSTVNTSASITSYHHVVVSGNTFSGRGLALYRSSDVIVADNTFDVTEATGIGVIDAENVSDNVKIDNNIIRRHGVAGPRVYVIPHSGGIPGPVSITNNTMVLDTNADAIYADGVRGISVRDNDITFVNPAPDASGVHLQAINGPINRAMITGNTITGPLSAAGVNTYFAAVRLDARPQPFGDITVAMNSARGANRSFTCSQSGAGLFPQPIISFGNRWTVAPTCTVAPIQPGQ